MDMTLKLEALVPRLDGLLQLAGEKTSRLDAAWDPRQGAPVFTRKGVYVSRGWTEWTQGFQFGMQLLLFDALGDQHFLDMGRGNTLAHMASHVSHTGVHDHGFNNISTYGNLHRLEKEGRTSYGVDWMRFLEMALKVSGAVQAARWSRLRDGTGFIHSFNGPHSLFSDTIRSCRSLMLAHQLGHCLMSENDEMISLLGRAIEHMGNTAKYNVYYGKNKDAYDAYDVAGRVTHESIFNMTDGRYRCPNTQQGYSPFSTWTRGLAWVMLGFAEQLEFIEATPEVEFESFLGRAAVRSLALQTARVTCDFYIANTPLDGVPYWDTGAPGLTHMGDYLERPAEPGNAWEPVDSSAAAIAAQGLLRFGRALGVDQEGKPYWQAGLTLGKTLFQPPYLSEDPAHQGLILHSVYHRPNGWDYIPEGKQVPFGESSMWGDYHALELAVYLKRVAEDKPYLCFHG